MIENQQVEKLCSHRQTPKAKHFIETERVGCFQMLNLRIEMYVDGGKRGHKGNAFFAPGGTPFDAVVVQNAVVDALGRGALLHFIFPSVRTAWDAGEKAQVPVGLGVDYPAVIGRRTVSAAFAGDQALDDAGASPLDAAAVIAAETPVNHYAPAGVNGTSVFVNP